MTKRFLALTLFSTLLAGCSTFGTTELNTITTEDDVTFHLTLERPWVKSETEIKYQAQYVAQDFCLKTNRSMLPKFVTSSRPATPEAGAHVEYDFECVGFMKAPEKDLNAPIHHFGYYLSEESKAQTLKELEEHPLEDEK